MAENHFDYLVIGGGSGGVSSARRAAGYGKKVGIVENARLGGTCVNVGCVPKKVMYNCAHIMETFRDSKHYGYNVEGISFNWEELKDKRDAYVARLNGIYGNMLGNSDVTKIVGTASFVGPKTIKVGEEEYTADNILIATGGYPDMPEVPGIEHCINSDGFFDIEEQPMKVAVVGAGYIAVEMAGILHALGTFTHLFVRGDMALRKFDPIVKESLHAEMARTGLKVHPGSNVKSVEKQEDGKLTLHLKNDTSHHGFDVILMAIGRKPAVDALNLPAAQVEQEQESGRGYIIADELQQTSAEGVFALGDVCGKVELTPMAIAAGRRLADRLFNGMEGVKADYDLVPTVVFSHPTIGTCGYTESEAREKFGEDNLKIYTSTFTNLYYGPWQIDPSEKQKTKMKVICEGPSERVVGMHLFGMGADEMLQGFGVAMKMGCTKSDLDSCIAIHPTAAEELVTLAPWGMSGKK
eukprot:CAMPEP_0113935778 /NCGR_PEP_ID=MMETSP1339-20121228/2855_1 /TAXON_ID=94617 /ORGANISM="Fibrocapsa japonica" /LENGTH=466 /DNA_ID=CAMNT_0000938037 /DNA_START=144 /DNA_END=1544 /DNA_ORIENTATION=- /assembly_acc=CAM_ASM_000762